tara:strand:+ start:19622 stop:20053 length:432 start_codon:yes stop_codon:yes gene_type:complete
MSSSIKYPENVARWFIEGDKICLITSVNSDGEGRTSSRKKFQAISESITDGLLVHYYGEPNSVSAITDSLDIDNTMHSAVVDYVKKCLYMDRASQAQDPNVSAASIQLSNMHQKNFDEAIRRFGSKKRDKIGGTRSISPIDFR